MKVSLNLSFLKCSKLIQPIKNIWFLLVDPAPLAPFRCPINIATTMTATKMIPTVPNVDASAAVEIPCTGAGVSATAVVVGISGCNGITYFRFPYFRYKLLLPV